MAARLEEIKNGASVRGVASAQPVHVISVDWIGDQGVVIPLVSLATVFAALAVLLLPETARRELEEISAGGDSR